MTRKITIHIHKDDTTGMDPTPQQYSDLANTIWMVMRATSFDFEVEPDGKADTRAMDRAWTQYGKDASWNG